MVQVGFIRLEKCPGCDRDMRLHASGLFQRHRTKDSAVWCRYSLKPSGAKDVRRPGTENPGAMTMARARAVRARAKARAQKAS
jgi:hypothetical protein